MYTHAFLATLVILYKHSIGGLSYRKLTDKKNLWKRADKAVRDGAALIVTGEGER